MPIVIMHVFDGTTGQEMSEADAFAPDTVVHSFNTDLICEAKDKNGNDILEPSRRGKTFKQDFIDRIASIKQRALIEKPCSRDYCHWCKDCFNKVADAVGRKADKIP
jgi:hypothetical protein